jgi:hypothetical protein
MMTGGAFLPVTSAPLNDLPRGDAKFVVVVVAEPVSDSER